VVASITLSLLGVNSYLAQSGTGLDLGNLLIFSAGVRLRRFVYFTADIQAHGQVVDPGRRSSSSPPTAAKNGCWDTVRELSEKAGIGMPEVGVFPAQQSNAFATAGTRTPPGGGLPGHAATLPPGRSARRAGP
jgi:heat shock protein HtpX